LKQSIDEEVKRFLALPISYNILFPTSRAKKIKTDKKIYVLEPSLLNSPLSSNEDIPPH
jgi:hypothetical protein